MYGESSVIDSSLMGFLVSLIRKYCQLKQIISIYWHTIFARLSNWPYLNCGKGVRLHKGLQIKQFFWQQGDLRITLCGKNKIGAYTVIQGSAKLTFGVGSYCCEYCVFGVNEKIDIGRNVMIAPAVTIRDTDHCFDRTDIPMRNQGIITSPVTIEDDVWIGHGAIILKGVTIGTGAVVAAGAVVVKDVLPFSIVGGVPAKVISSRKPQTDANLVQKFVNCEK
ncbi:hypothetical protein MNBD_GAMMA01-794 [hydrothermal vent metagenome]|uniref:Galactoside O-acetyltransferase n=1 Tax=hydrothermal vent metagenome TaxID=652676 RepID=A0A3B0VKE1_9ZZZZ